VAVPVVLVVLVDQVEDLVDMVLITILELEIELLVVAQHQHKDTVEGLLEAAIVGAAAVAPVEVELLVHPENTEVLDF
jgi:NADH/NAD ratio-sensing transcriptional regulator Rex